MVDTAEGLWLSISEIALSRGVGKSSISRRVARLEDLGLIQTKAGVSGQKLVNLAAFDKATNETTDAVREANGRGPGSGRPTAGKGLASEQRRRVGYQADLAALDLAERMGKMLPTEDVEAAMAEAGTLLVRELNALPNQAESLCEAVAKEGVYGARAALKGFVYDLRRLIAGALIKAAEGSGDPEPWPKTQERLAEIEEQTRRKFRDLLGEEAI